MTSQHKYKAIRTDGGGWRGWVEGGLLYAGNDCWIVSKMMLPCISGNQNKIEPFMSWRVNKETVCEFVVHHSRKAKGTEPAIEFDIYTGDVLYVAGVGEVTCVWANLQLAFMFDAINDDDGWLMYGDIIEDIERVVRNVHDEKEG
jgi:hypothetical protein